jgi:hypothetical protein
MVFFLCLLLFLLAASATASGINSSTCPFRPPEKQLWLRIFREFVNLGFSSPYTD